MRARSRYRLLGALLCALALAGCAHENPHLIAQDRADALTATVDEVAQLVADNDCAGARKAVAKPSARSLSCRRAPPGACAATCAPG